MISTWPFIGGGSGGYAAARTAAGAGLKTVVIEGGAEVGGLCILRGCMPTKALLYAAEVLHLASHPEPWGIRAGKIGFDFAKVMARKNALIKDFADYRVQQLNAGKFKFIRANARFVDAHTVELGRADLPVGQDAQQRVPTKLTARHFVIATGSRVSPSPLPQLNDAGYITSDDALALKRLPQSLIILGGGAIACEFAQFFARFGVKVTLIQRSGHILKEFDADAGMEIEKVFPPRRHQGFHRHKIARRAISGSGVPSVRIAKARCPRHYENRFIRAGGQNHFRFRRRNFVCAGPRAEHRVARPGKCRSENGKWPRCHGQQNADQRAAHLRGRRLHRAA